MDYTHMADFEVMNVIRGPSQFSVVAFSNDGNFLAAASKDQIFLRDATTGDLICILDGHDDDITVLKFSDNSMDEIILASGSKDCCCLFWNIRTVRRDLMRSVPPDFVKNSENCRTISSLDFCFGNKYVATASIDGVFRFISTGNQRRELELATPEPTRSCINTSREICSIGVSFDDFYVAAGYSTGRVDVFCAYNGELVASHRRHDMQVPGLCYSPDGLHFATASWDRTVKLSPALRLADTRILTLEAAVFSIAFSPCRPLLACGLGTPARCVLLWDWQRDARARLLDFKPASHAVAFSPNGAAIAFVTQGGAVEVHDLLRRRARLALAMALHPRLGGASGLYLLEPALVRLVAGYLEGP
jgi:WD40 repeat protein